jgi:serine protease
VAGTIGAASNNGQGVAGVNWQAKILPVRVLGKCGGSTSDIVDGARWAAGLSVPGVPANAHPADVINLSLGGDGSCLTTEQDAFTEIKAAGTTVVIAAGNSNDDASGFSPGNCNNVITVAATDRGGDRASYSNFGSVVEVSGPGGETATASNGILSTLNSGTTTPANDAYAFYQGTSMAAPHVAGLAALIIGQQPAITPDQVLSTLQATARPFPLGSSCHAGNCGAGIVDAFAALSSLSPLDKALYLPLLLQSGQPPPPPPPNPIMNPDFEQGPTGWTQFSSTGFPLIVNENEPDVVPPHGGQWAVWLGGGLEETSYIEQTITVPAGAPYFTFWHWISSKDVCGFDFAGVVVNGNEVADVYDLCVDNNTSGWQKHAADLSAYVGQSVAVQIRVETDELLNSSLFVDDVSFESQPPG